MKKSIKCENDDCIYYKDKVCMKKEITLDYQGRCKDSIAVFPKEKSDSKGLKNSLIQKGDWF